MPFPAPLEAPGIQLSTSVWQGTLPQGRVFIWRTAYRKGLSLIGLLCTPHILAVPAYFGIDPVESAKWMNMLLWGYSIFVAGIIAWRSCGRSWIYGLLAAVFLLVSSDMIEIFAQVLSEGLFIALLL